MPLLQRLQNCLIFVFSCSLILVLAITNPQLAVSAPVSHEQQIHDLEQTEAIWAASGARYYIKHPDGFYMCTVGFPATDSNNRHFFITAGHCGDPGDIIYRAVYHDNDDDPMENLYGSKHYETQLTRVGSFIAKLNGNRTGKTIDIAMVLVDEGKRIPGGLSQWPTNLAAPQIGMPICKDGISSGHTCGTITRLNKLVHPNNYQVTLIGNQTNMCVISGDSGGPVISGNYAVGIVSAGAESDDCQRLQNNISFIANLPLGLNTLKTKFPTLHLV